MDAQQPIVSKGTTLTIGDRKATVLAIERTGVRVVVEGMSHRPLIRFAAIERAVQK